MYRQSRSENIQESNMKMTITRLSMDRRNNTYIEIYGKISNYSGILISVHIIINDLIQGEYKEDSLSDSLLVCVLSGLY